MTVPHLHDSCTRCHSQWLYLSTFAPPFVYCEFCCVASSIYFSRCSFCINMFLLMNYTVRLLARYFKQVTWLVVTKVRSKSFRLVTERCHYNAYYVTLCYVRAVIFLIIECGIACFLRAMRVFEVWALSSSPRLPLCQISFLSRPPFLS